jgi:hypothetical protein
MFQGTIPPPLRQIVHEHAATWPADRDVYVGCSGNFTIERTLAPLGRRLHSNDVNPYTCALGWYFAGQPVPFTLKSESREHLGWLEDSLDDGVGTVATLMMGTEFLDFVGRSTYYHLRMVEAHRDQWPRMYPETIERMKAHTLRLASFFAGDVRDYLDQVPDGAPVVLFPPFWADGYKTMFRGLEKHFDWPEPSYRPVDLDGKHEIIDRVVDRPNWLLGLQERVDELEPFRAGYVKVSPRAVPIWVYAQPGTTRYVGPRQKTAPILMPKIGPDEDLQGDLRLHQLTPAQFNGLRSQFLDPRIDPGDPVVTFAVSCGGKLIGAFGYKLDNQDGLGVYLMADFPVGWSKYKRLSKLIVMAATSREATHVLERLRSHRTIRWATTAFSDNPISGKYGRGIPGVRLLSRKECEISNHKWQLSYVGNLGDWDLAGALDIWSRKHGKVQRKPGDRHSGRPAELEPAAG